MNADASVRAGASGIKVRELEIGLVVPDLVQARFFFMGVYGAQELPEAVSRVLSGEKELRFTTCATVFKCWAPKGERESDKAAIPDDGLAKCQSILQDQP